MKRGTGKEHQPQAGTINSLCMKKPMLFRPDSSSCLFLGLSLVSRFTAHLTGPKVDGTRFEKGYFEVYCLPKASAGFVICGMTHFLSLLPVGEFFRQRCSEFRRGGYQDAERNIVYQAKKNINTSNVWQSWEFFNQSLNMIEILSQICLI